MNNFIPRLAVTAGDPAGIGPELCVLLAQQELPAQLIVLSDRQLLADRASQLNIQIQFQEFNASDDPVRHEPGKIIVLHEPVIETAIAGQLNQKNARYVLNTLDKAINGCLDGTFDGLVTGPVHKGIINDAGIPFTGHTEYLADHTGSTLPVMMLATSGLRVALVTTHLPLSKVAENITETRLSQVVEILHQDLQDHFGVSEPVIAVCGLNPHAGENGHLGREEIDIIIPVLNALRDKGMNLLGPLPADSLFTPDKLEQVDAVLAMYHDQGLPVLKHMGFGQAVNITLGLPIIRTSVDHGVALELAGTGKVKVSSLKYAVEIAAEMVGKIIKQ